MIVGRKLDDAVDKSSADQEIHKSDETVHVTCEKSGGMHLVPSGTRSYGWQAVWQAKGLNFFKSLV